MNKPLLEKSNLALRLSGYAASAGALLAIGSVAKGQVVYSGLQNLELSMPGDTVEIDLDGDMVTDFAFYMYGTSYLFSNSSIYYRYRFGYGGMVNPKTDSYKNSWMIRTTVSTYYSTSASTYYSTVLPLVNGLDAGVSVNNSQTMWSNYSYLSWPGAMGVGSIITYYGVYYSGIYGWGYGDFPGDEKYIGVRFYIGTDQHYGWIRASMGTELDPMTIIDWAYESTPGDGIVTGAGDDVGPEVTIDPGVTETDEETISVNIYFNEKASLFELSDLSITNGEASDMEPIEEGKHYTFNVTADGQGDVTIELPAGSVADLVGNENAVASVTYYYDDPSVNSISGLSEEGIKIYPNPADDNLHIELENESMVSIINMNGTVLYQNDQVFNETISLTGFAPGMYIVRVKNGDRVTQHRLVIE